MLLSLGHSNASKERFLELVRSFDINAIIDVRSSPASRFSHFNRGPLIAQLNDIGASYVFAGDKLGGLSAARVGYSKTARSQLFCDAVQEVADIGRRCRAALLCAEHDPVHCHRFLLIGRALSGRGETVTHILRTGEIETHAETEARMLRSLKLEPDLIRSDAAAMEEAYRVQAVKLGGLP